MSCLREADEADAGAKELEEEAAKTSQQGLKDIDPSMFDLYVSCYNNKDYLDNHLFLHISLSSILFYFR